MPSGSGLKINRKQYAKEKLYRKIRGGKKEERRKLIMATLYRIPKEIREENKVALNLNLRQLISCSVGAAIDLIIYFTLKPEIDQMLMVTLILVGGALLTSSKTIDGVSVWDFVFDYIRKSAYHYDKRTYRTKNRVITSLNRKYSELRAYDFKNKRIRKKVLKEEKKNSKKKTRLKAIL